MRRCYSVGKVTNLSLPRNFKLIQTSVRNCSSPATQLPPVEEQEVEKKFRPSPAILAALPSLGQCREISFTDTYFDNGPYDLTTKDMWLRQRNSTFELKWPNSRAQMAGADLQVSESAANLIDFYHESTNWAVIDLVLRESAGVKLPPPSSSPMGGLQSIDAIREAHARLKTGGLHVFATLRTTRLRYKLHLPVRLNGADHCASSKHTVHVDIDTVRFDPPAEDAGASESYLLGEVELVQAGGGLPASVALQDVFQQLGISPQPVRGKVLEYLYRRRPRHYQALVDCGLIAAKMGKQA